LAGNLAKICKAESGIEEGKERKNVDEIKKNDERSGMALGPIIKMLREKTGRNTFLLDEVFNAPATVAKYEREQKQKEEKG
jgi:hypothetical protein